MSPKQNLKSRRKNCAPKRVVHDTDDGKASVKHTLVLPQDPVELAKQIMEQPITSFFQYPEIPATFIEIVEKAKEEAVEGQELLYKCSMCNEKVYRSAAGLNYHLMNSCPGIDPHLTCLICQKKYLDSDKIIEHIQDDHIYLHLGTPASEAARRRSARQSRLKIQMFAESSSVAEELERNYSSLSDYEESQSQPPTPPPKESKKKETTKDIEVVHRQPRGTSGGSYTTVQSPLADAFLWTFNEKEKLEKQFPLVHSEIQPDLSRWVEVNLDDLLKTYQLHKESPAFVIENEFLNVARTGKRNSKNVITNKVNGNSSGGDKFRKNLQENYKYEKLKLFQSTEADNTHSSTFYIGGPVWGAAWCPHSGCTDTEDQYLALCSHFGEHSLEPQSLCHEMALLQVWNCGKLPVQPGRRFTLKPFLAYALVVDVGPIWAVEWCPLADSVLNLTPQVQRVGVVALGCGSGDVRIYALPKSHQHQGKDTSFTADGKLYSAPPQTILRPIRRGHFGQCKCVSWSVVDGSRMLVAGFSSGHVAVWDLLSTSKLLSGEENGVRIVYASHTFRGHTKPVNDLVFCPFNSNYFVSVGADRCLKIWDHRNTETDLPNFLPPKMSVIYEIHWPSLWCGVYASTDSAFSIPYFHGSIYLNMGSASNTLQNIVPQKSASWSVSPSDWLNSVASCDVAGNVVLNVCNNWNRQFISNKSYPRIALFQSELEWNDRSAVDSYLKGDVGFNEAQNSAYNIIFHDCKLSETVDKWKDTEAHLRVRTFEDFDDESYHLPAGSVQKVRWNPNLSSFTWIVSATHSGLVRLHCVSGLISAEVEDAWRSCRNN